MAISPRIYQFKITLERIKPPIWRRVLVPENYSFGELHKIIIKAMGWNDSHLHKFMTRSIDVEIGVPFPGDFGETIDETTVFLNQYFVQPKDNMKYEYDFGDGWLHKIELEKILPADDDKEYPVCIGGKRACPPEDCGGIGGYYNFNEIMADPSHPEYEETKTWLNDVFGLEKWDAEKFDYKEVVF